jgi:uncharacterized damage-inducible protein DinB
MKETERIRDQFERSFKGPSWHGLAVLEVLDGVTAAQAAARPVAHPHSIWDITLHMTTWKSVVARRVRGEVVGNIPDDEDWPPAGKGADEWAATVERLKATHEDLVAALGSLREEQLDEPPYEKASSRYIQLHGAIQHDLYHAGQIVVLKKG